MRPAAGVLPLRHSEFELFTRANVRFGSKADIALGPCHVRFSPRKRTSFSTVAMFALCHFRTYAVLRRAARLDLRAHARVAPMSADVCFPNL
jgi:hypothetical protein